MSGKYNWIMQVDDEPPFDLNKAISTLRYVVTTITDCAFIIYAITDTVF